MPTTPQTPTEAPVESVAGEEDPGAALDTPNPGDEAAEGTPGTGEAPCPRCGGTGHLGQAPCPDCAGTGKVVKGIGGA